MPITPTIKAARVLLVDDDRAVRTSLALALQSEAYEVTQAANGQEGLEQLHCGDIDLVLLDLNLPVKNGWDTFERMTAINPLLPIVLITARPNQYKLACAAGASALMEKPLHLPQLLQTISDLLKEPPGARLQRIAGYQRNIPHGARRLNEVRGRNSIAP